MSLSSSTFEDVGWYKATTLSERIELRRECVLPPIGKSGVAANLSQRWRSQAPFHNDLSFSRRLEVLGVSNDEFHAILGEPAASICARCPKIPAWLDHLSDAFSSCLSERALPLQQKSHEPIFGLLNVAGRLVTRSLAQLKKDTAAILRKHSHPPLSPEMLEKVFGGELARQLLHIVSKVAVLELNVARVQGSLEGRTREDRFDRYVERLSQPETALEMMREYPVLARQLVQRIRQWADSTVEFVDRLCSDWDLILRTFGPNEVNPGLLKDVRMDAGDRHRGGRCVFIATFDSGFKLVYKPKPMGVDAHFQDLLTWINDRGEHPPLRKLKILNRGSYGWSEFVAAESCRSIPELRRFYQRQGAYLALLYVLEGTDFHSENIIAAGEHPILIDLEAVFHPRLEVPEHSEEADGMALSHSVLRVGLLPRQGYANEQSNSADLSGLGGGSAGQLTAHKVPYWEAAGTDEMRLSRRQMPMSVSANRPALHELDVASGDYVEEILEGFTSVYRQLMKHRDELVSRDGPLQRFGDDEVRVIFRPTKTYGILLAESFHPDVMRDALERDLLFDKLWISVEASPYLAKVISAECEDLQRGDIPLFTTRPNSLHVWTSTNKCVPNLFEESPLSSVERRLRELNDVNLSLQRWLIRASLATSVTENSQVEPHRGTSSYQKQGLADRAQLLGAACAVGNKLECSAITWNESASWVGLAAANDFRWCISTTMLDLYDGLPGIALFLAYLGSITGELRYTHLAKRTCNTMLRRVEKYESRDMGVGAFAGWGGIVYTLAHLCSLWHEPALLSSAEEMVQRVHGLIASDEHLDIIAGSAGCIGSLIVLHQQRQSPSALVAAKACGEHLIATAKQMPNGIGWIIPKQVVPLAGFAHGVAGIAWALFQLAEVTGEEVFAKTAETAIAHERSLFDRETANWYDLRAGRGFPNETGKPAMSAWCHGAAGIGLGRLATPLQLENDEVRREIDTALMTTLRVGLGNNHSLCHGDAGSIELFQQACLVLNDQRWNLEAHRIAHSIVDAVSQNEFRCGTPLNVVSPGLMTGLAGIGYELLRLAEPVRVPSVLTLQPAIEPLGE